MRAVHNKVSEAQKNIQAGDMVNVTLDDGSVVPMLATSAATKLGGHTWVIGVEGSGKRYTSYALSRVKPKPKTVRDEIDHDPWAGAIDGWS